MPFLLSTCPAIPTPMPQITCFFESPALFTASSIVPNSRSPRSFGVSFGSVRFLAEPRILPDFSSTTEASTLVPPNPLQPQYRLA